MELITSIFNAPFRVYKDALGILGTVYTTFIDNDIFYLGTNQGLFYKNRKQNGRFKLIEGTKGQVWSLQQFNNTLFCGHDKGTFIITNGKAQKLPGPQGTWKIHQVKKNPNLLIQGNYNGLYILEKVNNAWRLRNKLDGFDISSRYFESVQENEYLVNHEHKGVYHLKVDASYTKILSYSKTEVDKSIKSSLTTYHDELIYGSNKGVFHYDKTSSKFTRDSILSHLYSSSEYTSGKLINTNNKLFAFTKENITYAQRGKLSTKYELTSLPLPYSLRETKDGYENILFIGDGKYLIGTTAGYIIADLNTKDQGRNQIKLDAITSRTINGKPKTLNLFQEEILKNHENYLTFSFSSPSYNKYLPPLYKYRLKGFNDVWSEWTSKPEADFENLPYGEHTFEVKSKLGDLEATDITTYTFEIEKPIYLKPIAIIFYFIGGFLIVLLINFLNRIYYKKRRREKEKELEIKHLESEQQLMQLKNLTLQKDIDAKSRELGLSTMNLIKRNELLGTIKKELNSIKSTDEILNVVKLINRNLNTTDDWKLFEEAFESADKGFIKNLKNKHTNLTSNDLRLCTYLRLNLSSKEIAPLLNISIRSVEVKRYRLRKKMNLPHQASLSNYILQL